MTSRRTRIGLVVASAALVGGSLAACGNDTDGPVDANGADGTPETEGTYAIDEIPEVAVNEEIQSMVPEAMRDVGILDVGHSGNYPPMEYHDEESGEYVGFDVDLARAIADVMGLEYAFQNMPDFDQIINGLITDRIDMSITGMIDSAERQEQLDFINYLETGTLVYTYIESDIQGLEDLCGNAISMARGTLYAEQVNELSDEQCADDPIEIVEVDGTPDAQLQLVQGRSDAAIAAPEVFGLLNAQEPDTFRHIEPPITTSPMGIGVSKDRPELRDAVFAAVEELMESGVYDELIDKWGLDASAINEATMNAGT